MFATIHNDLRRTLSLMPIILLLALSELKAKYKRTFLGPFWVIIGLGVGSFGLGVLWSHLWNVPAEDIIPKITLGLLTWIFISGTIIDSSTCFVGSGGMIKNIDLPKSFYPMACLVKQLITYLHSLVIVLVVTIIYPPENFLNFLWYIPALMIALVALFFICFLVGGLSARFRDIPPLVSSAMPILFFLSPVLFRIQQAGDIAWLLWVNPMTYIITMLRDPLAGAYPGTNMFVASLAMAFVSYLLVCFIFGRKINRLVYWV